MYEKKISHDHKHSHSTKMNYNELNFYDDQEEGYIMTESNQDNMMENIINVRKEKNKMRKFLSDNKKPHLVDKTFSHFVKMVHNKIEDTTTSFDDKHVQKSSYFLLNKANIRRKNIQEIPYHPS